MWVFWVVGAGVSAPAISPATGRVSKGVFTYLGSCVSVCVFVFVVIVLFSGVFVYNKCRKESRGFIHMILVW